MVTRGETIGQPQRAINLGRPWDSILQGAPSPVAVKRGEGSFDPKIYIAEVQSHIPKESAVAGASVEIGGLSVLATLWAVGHATPLLPLLIPIDVMFGVLLAKKTGDAFYDQIQIYRTDFGRRTPKTVR